MTDKKYNVLFLCTGNTARSILAESILRKDGAGRFNAFSAGSHPKAQVNPFALKTLAAHGYPVDGLRSKNWDEFAAPGAAKMDFVFTVCDNAAGEACPFWPGSPATAHWGIEDHGYKVSSFRVAVDALAVYVNKDNPVECLTMEQVDRIFSSTRKGSGGKSIDTWGDVGLTGDWASKPISIYGRNTISGTYEFFRQTALFGGDYKPEVKPQVGSEAVVEGVAGDKFAIGYSGLGYKTNGVRAVPLSVFFGGKCYDTSVKSVLAGKYPLARYLYIYVNKKPGEAARRAARRVHQIYCVQGRPDADGKGRLLPDHRGNPRGRIAEVGAFERGEMIGPRRLVHR